MSVSVDGERQLPHGWFWSTLENLLACEPRAITDGPFGSNLKSAHYTDSGARVIRLQNVGDGEFRDERAYISLEHFETLRAHEAIAGDLLLASLGETLPRVAILPKLDEPAIVKADVIRARLHREVLTKWVYYTLLAPQARAYAGALIKGVGRPRLGMAAMKAIPIPVPPLAEQHRIVEVLEEQLSRLEAARHSLLRVESMLPRHSRALNTAGSLGRLAVLAASESRVDLADIERQRRAAWTEQFGQRKYKEPVEKDGDFLLEVPDGWCVASLEQVTNPVRIIRYGILKPKVRGQGVVPYVEVRDLAGCSLVGKTLNRTTTELDEQFSGARTKPRDLLIAVRGSYERSAVVPPELDGANISRDVARIAPLQFLLPEFLQIYLQSEAAQRYLKEKARGVAVKGVNISALRAMPVPVPPMNVQRTLVEEVQDQDSIASAVSMQVQRAQRRARSLRSALLRTAFAGDLVPQDPTDEPASALLSRIAAERAAQPKAKSTRKPADRKAAVPRPAAPADPAPEPTPAPALAVQQEFDL